MKIGVVGQGFMGTGIVESILGNTEHKIYWMKFTDGDPDIKLKKLEEKWYKKYDKIFSVAHKFSNSLYVFNNSDKTVLKDCDIIIESVVEDLSVKQKLFSDLDKIVKKDAIFATNTSTLSVDKIFKTRKDRSCGLHFFSPVTHMKLVEVVGTSRTNSETLEEAFSFVQSLDKEPIYMKDSPGFVVNRVLVPMILSAIRLVEDGNDIDSVDKAMKLGCSHPMGPLELADFIGLDIMLAMSQSLWKETGEKQCKPPKLLKLLVKKESLGKKSSNGFYAYYDKKRDPNNIFVRTLLTSSK